MDNTPDGWIIRLLPYFTDLSSNATVMGLLMLGLGGTMTLFWIAAGMRAFVIAVRDRINRP